MTTLLWLGATQGSWSALGAETHEHSSQAASAGHAKATAGLTGGVTVEWQPFAAQIQRLIEATESLGNPFLPADLDKLRQQLQSTNGPEAVLTAQGILDRYCLFQIAINPESRVKAAQGAAAPELDEQGWRVFLIRVQNEAGVTAELRVSSPQGKPIAGAQPSEVQHRWMQVDMVNRQPLKPALSGLGLEYRLIQIFSRDAGERDARFSFDVGQGTQDLGFRSDVDILFRCRPAAEVKLGVQDENGKPTTARFIIRDSHGRVYPSQAKRIAPDFHFHPQIYRADGETVHLPSGEYQVEITRGPEYRVERRALKVPAGGGKAEFAVKLARWVDPSLTGWWSGDHHIHAAGCAHYERPTEGVLAPDMMRHCLGEDLKIGANLTWGPCFDFQKQFFTGKDDKVSAYPYLLRYDVEVSGFGSHESGHLCLLRLKEQIYPGGDSKNHWPKLCLNTLRWAKAQGALVGPAHSGWGLEVSTSELPNYIVPPFNGIGANEFIVDVTHEVPGPEGKLVPAVDFLSTVDTPHVWELNMWYHVLNAGFRTRISGETDFPCIYGERVGLGRSYVHLGGKLDYEDWCEGIRAGRNYVSDGKSHLLDLQAAPAGDKSRAIRMGEAGSELRLEQPGGIHVELNATALLNELPDQDIRHRPYNQKPYWDLERAREGDSRNVPVELLVNGYPVARKTLLADGHQETIAFDTKIDRSSWIAVRILASSHTNPIFVTVGGKPIRASRRSVEWCAKGVEQCWSQKKRFMPEAEMPAATQAYEHARQVYAKLLGECDAD